VVNCFDRFLPVIGRKYRLKVLKKRAREEGFAGNAYEFA
jgi:hypothetical protein